MHKQVTILIALTMVASPALAGSPDEPEIEDDAGDVDVQHLVDAGLLVQAGVSRPAIDAAADVTDAWITSETRGSFEVAVQLSNLPDNRNISTPLSEVWLHFEILDGSYHARAVLSSPQPGAPLQANYELFLDDEKQENLKGSVDNGDNIVWFHVPKQAVRDPGEGDKLTQFYVTTHLPGPQPVLDYAPGATAQSIPDASGAESADPTSLQLSPTPNHGDHYTFDSFDSKPSMMSIDVTPSSLEVEAGESEEFAVRIVNDGEGAGEVSLSVGNTPDGWSVNVEPTKFTVDPASSKTATLHVTPASDAEGHELVQLQMSSAPNTDKQVSVSITATQPGSGGGTGGGSVDGDTGTQDSTDGTQDSQATDEQTDSGTSDGDGADGADGDGADGASADDNAEEAPFVGPVAVIAAALAVAGLVRRGRT